MTLYDSTFKSHWSSSSLSHGSRWGVVVAIKTKTLVAALVAAAVPFVVSTWLFFATGTSACELGEHGKTDLIFLVSIGLAALLAYAGGAIAGQQERRPVVAIAMLVASSLTILGHVQWDNCSGFSKQISRELDAHLDVPRPPRPNCWNRCAWPCDGGDCA